MRLTIDAASINDLQRASIKSLIARAKGAHYTNVHLRINGRDEVVAADWIKHLRVEETP